MTKHAKGGLEWFLSTRINFNPAMNRHIQLAYTVNEPPPNTTAENECDTNADRCCLGKNFSILNYTNCSADVYLYQKSLGPVNNIPIVTRVTARDGPTTGVTSLIIFNEALYYGTDLDHTLINPNQVRHYSIPFWDNPYDKDRGLNINIDDQMSIPLDIRGQRYHLCQELRHQGNSICWRNKGSHIM